MAHVCVGCGLEVVDGKLALASAPMFEHDGATISPPDLDFAGTDTVWSTFGPVGTAQITNQSDCRAMGWTFNLTVLVTIDHEGGSMGVGVERRVDGGAWERVWTWVLESGTALEHTVHTSRLGDWQNLAAGATVVVDFRAVWSTGDTGVFDGHIQNMAVRGDLLGHMK